MLRNDRKSRNRRFKKQPLHVTKNSNLTVFLGSDPPFLRWQMSPVLETRFLLSSFFSKINEND